MNLIGQGKRTIGVTRTIDRRVPSAQAAVVPGFEAVELRGTARVIGTLHAANRRSPASMQGARGDDDLMSQQQQQSMSSMDAIHDIWKQRIGQAKANWAALTEEELLQTQGTEEKLAILIQNRYAISHEEAGKQIRSFADRFRY